MKRICVFCGSSPGARGDYARAADQLGQELVRRGVELIYGGAGVGLMGRLADTVLAGGGRVTGVMPGVLVDKGVAHEGLTALRVVETMHERKALMVELSEGFVALPGGMGTMDELFEVMTWAQLGIHRWPSGLLNVAGYYDPLRSFLRQGVKEGFIRQEHVDMLLVETTPGALLDRFAGYEAPVVNKWRGG